MSRRRKYPTRDIPDHAAIGRTIEIHILRQAPTLGSWVSRWAADDPLGAISDTTVRQVVRGAYNLPNDLSLFLLRRFAKHLANEDDELAQIIAYDILRAGGLVPDVSELSNTTALKRMSDELHALTLATNRHTRALAQQRKRKKV